MRTAGWVSHFMLRAFSDHGDDVRCRPSQRSPRVRAVETVYVYHGSALRKASILLGNASLKTTPAVTPAANPPTWAQNAIDVACVICVSSPSRNCSATHRRRPRCASGWSSGATSLNRSPGQIALWEKEQNTANDSGNCSGSANTRYRRSRVQQIMPAARADAAHHVRANAQTCFPLGCRTSTGKTCCPPDARSPHAGTWK